MNKQQNKTQQQALDNLAPSPPLHLVITCKIHLFYQLTAGE